MLCFFVQNVVKLHFIAVVEAVVSWSRQGFRRIDAADSIPLGAIRVFSICDANAVALTARVQRLGAPS